MGASRPRPRHDSAHRAYRDTVQGGSGEAAFRVQVEQSDLLVVADAARTAELREAASAALRAARGHVKSRIALDSAFAESLEPVPVPEGAPDIVKRMAEAAAACGVGPMAAVAGAVAQSVAEALAELTTDALVENGGDCFLVSTRERTASLLADPSSGARLGVRFTPMQFPLALCASSGTIGHSLSLGSGDLVAVHARDGAFADAAATALGNLLRGPKDVERVIARAEALREHAPAGVLGVFAQYGEVVAAWGDMELITLGGA